MRTIKDIINNKAKELFKLVQEFKINKGIIEKTILTKEELDSILKKEQFKRLLKDEQTKENLRNIYLEGVKNDGNNFELLLNLLEKITHKTSKHSYRDLNESDNGFMYKENHLFYFNGAISCFDIINRSFEDYKDELNNLLSIFNLRLEESEMNGTHDGYLLKDYYVNRGDDLLISLIFGNSLNNTENLIKTVYSIRSFEITSSNYKNMLLDLIRVILNNIVGKDQIKELENLLKMQIEYGDILIEDNGEVIIEDRIFTGEEKLYYLEEFVDVEFNEESMKLNEEIKRHNNKEEAKVRILEREFDLFIDRLEFAECSDLVIKNIEMNKEEVVKEKRKELNLKEYLNVCKFKIKDEYKELFLINNNN